MRKLTAIVGAMILLASCSRENDKEFAGTKIYYEYFSDVQAFPQTNANLTQNRVCYNVDKDEVVWEKPNEYHMPYAYAYWNQAFPYSETFSSGDHLVKIFSTSDVPSVYPYITNGVYFQKINKGTGNADLSKKIVQAADLNTNDAFVISSVVTDGTNYYFACSNNFVYSVDGEGNLRWKKGAYPMRNLWRASQPIGTGYSYLYYNDNRIYFMSGNPGSPSAKGVYCLSAATGDLLWASGGQQTNYPKELMFHDAHVFDVGQYGVVSMYNKVTGDYVGTAHPPSTTSSNARPIGKINNRFIGYFLANGDIGHVEIAHPDVTTVTYLTGVQQLLTFAADEKNGKVYAEANGASNTFQVYGIDMLNGVDWRVTFTRNTPVVTFEDYEVLDFRLKNGSLYMLTTFHIEGNDCVPNELINFTLPGSSFVYKKRAPGLIVLSTGSGSVVKQCKKLPVGPYETKLYNFYVD